MSAMMPLGMGRMGLGGLSLPGAPMPTDRRGPPPPGWLKADWNVVEPDYFKTMRMPLVGGRDFTAADRLGAPYVVIVNETAARQMWPNQDPLGKVLVHHLDRRGTADSSRPMTVVGVAKDVSAPSSEEPTVRLRADAAAASARRSLREPSMAGGLPRIGRCSRR